MKMNKWQRLVSLILFAGVMMKLFDLPYGKLVFTLGFGGYFLLKLSKLFQTRIRQWTGLHFVQLTLILIAVAALLFMYYDYAYSRLVFGIALASEGLVALRIKLNTMFGSQNVNGFFRFLVKAFHSRQTGRSWKQG